MNTTRILTTLMAAWLCWLGLPAQPLHRVTYYDEADGVPTNHVTQLLQDQHGFLWIATWNGLCRYDGYEFHTFKPSEQAGSLMMSDRMRNISLRADGQIICRVRDDDYALFDPCTCTFTELTGSDAQSAADEAKRYRESKTMVVDDQLKWTDNAGTQWRLQPTGQLSYADNGSFTDCEQLPASRNLHFASRDHQGNLWVIAQNGIYKIVTDKSYTRRLPMQQGCEAKCLFIDSHRRCWVCTNDGAIRLYDSESERLLGYVGPDGRLHDARVCFPAPVYCIYEAADGTLWLGTKPDGIYRLRPLSDKAYTVSHLTHLPDPNIYAILSDHQGRLWVATLGGGLCYTAEPQADDPIFTVPTGYPHDKAQLVRRLHLTRQGILLASTTDGLVVTQTGKDAEKMQFRLHQRESDRAGSLSSNATMAILETTDGQMLISTENSGINRCAESDLMAEVITFTHIIPDEEPSHSVVQALAATDRGGWMAVNGRQLTLFDSLGHYRMMDAHHLQGSYRFNETTPIHLSGDRWLFGTDDGAFIMDGSMMRRQAYTPRVVLTSLTVQGGQERWNVEYSDTLCLRPDERSIIVRFAALDFTAPERISYAFRLLDGTDSVQWNDLGRNRTLTLLDLEPGEYHLQLRSTDSGGQWQDNIRQLCILVAPSFWEAWYGRLLLTLIVLGLIGAIVYTTYYIRAMHRQQREMQEKYLSLLDERSQQTAANQPPATGKEEPKGMQLSDDDEAFMTRVMAYIEQHIGDPEANIDDMAAEAAVSRSGLIRKLKSIVGQTPANFLREARIKRAGQLLASTAAPVADIAYKCGFTEPKYFSKIFRASTGMSPSDYRTQQEAPTPAQPL